MKTILITGGTGKIGGQLVRHFLADSWNVAFTSRSADGVDRLVERFKWNDEQTNRLIPIEVDFYSENTVPTISAALKGKNLIALVNNARDLSSLKVGDDGLSRRTEILNEYLIDVIVPYELSVRLLQEHSGLNSIINVGSIYGSVPFNPHLYDERYPAAAPIQYSLAKAALNHLTKELAIRYRKRCRVNTVSYGGVEGRVDQEFRKRYAQLCPEETMLNEEQTVGPVRFLVSDAAKGITGQNIIQDGGWTVW